MTVIFLFLIAGAPHLPAVADDEIPIRVNRLNEKAIVLSTGETDVWANVAAFAAEKGIVVVDTSAFPAGGAEIRKRIEKELGRRDIAWVVNTHDHFDHTLGNQAFSDTVIVGHERCARAVRGFAAGLSGFVENRRQRIALRQAELESGGSGSGEARRKREFITHTERMLSELESDFVPTPPEVTFNDRLTLHLGDMTLNLIYYGEAHAEGDLLVHVPELRLLLVGDLFSKGWLPGIEERRTGVSGWLEVLNPLLDGEGAVERVVPGHGEIMTAAELRAQRDYLRDLRDGVAAAFEEGLSLADARERLAFENGFKHLENLRHTWEGEDFHEANVGAIWRSLQ
jgi:glyoxylase-like metal-dependent hydrolase (beta-lactamase superfamily II)